MVKRKWTTASGSSTLIDLTLKLRKHIFFMNFKLFLIILEAIYHHESREHDFFAQSSLDDELINFNRKMDINHLNNINEIFYEINTSFGLIKRFIN